MAILSHCCERIINFTSELSKLLPTHFTTFNPSVVRIGQTNGYLGVSRVYRVYDATNPADMDMAKMSQSIEETSNSRHPWSVSWKPENYGENLQAIDGSVFFTFQLVGDRIQSFRLVNITGSSGQYTKILNVDENGTLSYPDNLQGYILHGAVDARIYDDALNQSHLLTYNVFVNDRPPTIARWSEKTMDTDLSANRHQRCSKNTKEFLNKCSTSGQWCGLMMIARVKLIFGNLSIYSEKVVCPNCTEQLEKNFTLLRDVGGSLTASYMLEGSHMYLKLPNGEEQAGFGVIECDFAEVKSLVTQTITELKYPMQLSETSTSGEQKIKTHNTIAYSLSTPYVLWDNKQYLAVGHIKINYHVAKTLLEKDPNNKNIIRINDILHKYGLMIQNHDPHPHYAYFMFFYTLHKETKEITNVSQIFVPYLKAERYSVHFASGLTITHDDKFMVTYGVGDIQCNFAIMTRQQIQQLFIAPHDLTQVLVLVSPQSCQGRQSAGKTKKRLKGHFKNMK